MGSDKTIDVRLEGEAFFEADSGGTQDQPAFAVMTPDGTIRDIGTKFLVTVRRENSRVILQEIVKKEFVNPTFYTSWATEFMEMDRTKLSEFARYIEKQFNTEVQIKDPDLMDVTLTGAVYFKSLEELVKSVSEVTGIPVYQSLNRETVYIGDPNN